MLWCIVAVLLLALALASFVPVTTANSSDTPRGGVMVEVVWPPDNAADVDLWVQAPGDVPVGYSNKGGRVFNLLRDDLGNIMDQTGINYENSYSRGTPAGEYTINLMLYRSVGRLPVKCRVVVSVRGANDVIASQIAVRDVELTREGEEQTAVRFALTDKGSVVLGSINHAPKSLRSAVQ
jgi:hypothetical protein